MTSSSIDTTGIHRAGGILDKIVDSRLVRLAESNQKVSIDELRSRLPAPSDRPFSSQLKRPGQINIIAEIKHRSPSKGILREDFDPVSIARSYLKGGAAALSVLTEQDFFGGSLQYLEAVRSAVSLPVLRKDFIISEYQLVEAAVSGAHAALLIVAILEDSLLHKLIGAAKDLGIETLVEVHSADELARAVSCGAEIIGVNNRDLTTFEVDLHTSVKLASVAPTSALLVSESGIASPEDIRLLSTAGYSAFLVGEHFMRRREPGDALAELLEQSSLS